MIPDIQELNFPTKDGKQYATLTHATVSLADMGEKTITAQVKIDGDITPDFSRDWEVVFQGEKYIMPLRSPQGAKENTSLNATIDLVFHHWAEYELKRHYFVSIARLKSGAVIADKFVVPLNLNLEKFCDLFGEVLGLYYNGDITIDLNKDWASIASAEAQPISISYSYIWDVLLELYKIWGVRWQIEPNGSVNKYVIKVGYPTEEVNHIFEYGFKGGLLKVERLVQDENIKNVIYGRGGEKNLPYRYFKDVDPENPSFPADPDWIPELRGVGFDRLRDKSYRDYIKGWKTNPNRQLTEADGSPIVPYGSTTPIRVENYNESLGGINMAYKKGHEDAVFDPVEAVRADGYQLEDGKYHQDKDSISKYGVLPGALDDNDDIYPTIQGVVVDGIGRVDEVIAVEQILSDDVEEAVKSDAKIVDAAPCKKTQEVAKNSQTDIVAEGERDFFVPEGQTGVVEIYNPYTKASYYDPRVASDRGSEWSWVDAPASAYERVDIFLQIIGSDGKVYSASALPSGKYRYKAIFRVRNKWESSLKITVGAPGLKLITSVTKDQWENTFNIWIKNIFGTKKKDGETDAQYIERVWTPLLGDSKGSEAKVIFSDGWLSTSEDYEFKIVKGGINYDTTESFNGVASHWRLTLAKSDADLNTLGLYVPSTQRQGNAGDHIHFTGIELPHQYTLWAETDLHDSKLDFADKKSDIDPTWAVGLDRVRITNRQEGEAIELIKRLSVGCSLRLADKRFIPAEDGDGEVEGRAYKTLYLQSITYTYREPSDQDAALSPDVEVVLSNNYEVVANPVSALQGEIESIGKRIGSVSSIEQLIRVVCDDIYLRKDGISDRSLSPTEFASLLTSLNFRSGIVGGAGWGFFQDADGNWTLEVDRANFRQGIQVNNLVINQITARGGMIIESAASMEILSVSETNEGYVCRFDQKNGTVANLFEVDDIAMSMVTNERWSSDAELVKSYKRRIIAVSEDSITLSKEETNGTGVPTPGDVVVHYGNYNVPSRQYVKVRDVVNGGYERYLEGLDSVYATGKEYFFIGRQAGSYGDRPRWFIGDDGGFIEWVNGELNIKGRLNMLSTINDKPIDKFIKDEIENSTQTLVKDTDIWFTQTQSDTTKPDLPSVNEDGSIADAKGWSTDAPSRKDKWYIWQSTQTQYGNNKVVFSDPVCVSGHDGKDGVSATITEQSVTYAASNSGTTVPLSGWSEKIPPMLQGQYLWTKTEVRYSDGNGTVSYSVSRSGVDGSGYSNNLLLGTRDFNRNSWIVKRSEESEHDGFTVLTANSVSGSVTDMAKQSFSFIKGQVYTLSFFAKGSGILRTYKWPLYDEAGKYQDNPKQFELTDEYVRYSHTFTAQETRPDLNSTVTNVMFRLPDGVGNSASIYGVKMEAGENDTPEWSPAASEMLGVTVLGTFTKYAVSTVDSQPKDSEFKYDSVGATGIAKGQYLWVRVRVEYSDGSAATSYSVSRVGSDGEGGYVHLAYASGKTGSLPRPDSFEKFSKTPFEGAEYLGAYTDQTEEDSDDHTRYEWSEYRGVGIDHIEEEYYLSDSRDIPTGSSWKKESEKPAWKEGKYMWTRSHVYYTNGTDETYGEICATGATGNPGTSILARYSVTGGTSDSEWHSSYQTGDKWMQTSSDNGKTWGNRMPVAADNYSANLALGTRDKTVTLPSQSVVYNLAEPTDAMQGEWVTISFSYRYSDVTTGSALYQRRFLTSWAFESPSGTGAILYRECQLRLAENSTGLRGSGRVSASVQIPAGTPTNLTSITLYSQVISGNVHLYDLKVERGVVADPQWTPAASEMIGTDGKWLKTQWTTKDSPTEPATPADVWSDTPLTPSAGEYIWIRQGYVQPPATEPEQWLQPYQRITGDAGAAGEDTYLLDLSNEVGAVPCDSDGQPVAPAAIPGTIATVFRGSRKDSGWKIAINAVGCSAAILSTAGAIAIKSITADTAYVDITATKTGVDLTLSARYSLYKVIPGAPGEAAVVYSIGVSANNISKSYVGEYSTRTIEVTKQRTTGDTPMEATTEKSLWVELVGSSADRILSRVGGPAVSTIQIPDEATAIFLTLRETDSPTSAILDRERIPVITDASGLEIDGTNMLRNSAFSEGRSYWQFNATASLDYSIMLGTHPSAKISNSGLTSYQWLGVLQGIGQNEQLSAEAGSWWTASVKTYCEEIGSIDDGAYLEIQFINASGSRLSSKSVSIIPSAPDTWESFDVCAQAPAGTASVAVFANVRKNGTLNIAEPMLEHGVHASVWSPSPLDVDYLSAALRGQSRTEGGLFLSSHIKLGETSDNGTFTETAGMNGLIQQADASDLAYWSGGEMIDAAIPGVDMSHAATIALRHNGTAYFAKNTVRFRENGVEIGDNLLLDKDGLELINDDTSTALQIKNTSVGTNVTTTENVNIATGTLSDTLTFQKYTVTWRYNSPTGPELVETSWREMHLNEPWHSGRIPLNAALKAGDSFTLAVNISVPAVRDISWNTKLYIFICYTDSNGQEVCISNNNVADVGLNAEKTAYVASHRIKATLPVESSNYYVRMTLSATKPNYNTASWQYDVVPDNGLSYSHKLSYSATGTASRSIANRTVCGNDGFITVWGESAQLVNRDKVLIKCGIGNVLLESNKVTLGAGSTRFEVSSGGIRYYLPSVGQWKNLT